MFTSTSAFKENVCSYLAQLQCSLITVAKLISIIERYLSGMQNLHHGKGTTVL